MKALIIGSGRMGRAVAYDLLRTREVERVTICDRQQEYIDSARSWLARELPDHARKLDSTILDASDEKAATELARGYTVVVSASDYSLNLGLARAAIAAKAGFVDLGGNNTVVDAELALDEAARKAGVLVVPDCGLAPGMVSMLVADGMEAFDTVDHVAIRVGGVPARPRGLLRYQLVFSVRGLTNEYLEPAVVIRDGKVQTVESMTEVEDIEFPPPFGRMEAFQTSGGTSTLPKTYAGKVRNLDYKTIRYPGHCAHIRTLIDLGLLSEKPLKVGGALVRPREVVEAVLERELPSGEPDVSLVRVTIEGSNKGNPGRRVYQMIEHAQTEKGLTAMMRTTSFPAAAVAWMIGTGKAKGTGALPQEVCLPARPYIDALIARGLDIKIS